MKTDMLKDLLCIQQLWATKYPEVRLEVCMLQSVNLWGEFPFKTGLEPSEMYDK